MGIHVNWSRMGVGSIVAFLVAWWLFNLFTAVVLALVVMFLLGILKVD